MLLLTAIKLIPAAGAQHACTAALMISKEVGFLLETTYSVFSNRLEALQVDASATLSKTYDETTNDFSRFVDITSVLNTGYRLAFTKLLVKIGVPLSVTIPLFNSKEQFELALGSASIATIAVAKTMTDTTNGIWLTTSTPVFNTKENY